MRAHLSALEMGELLDGKELDAGRCAHLEACHRCRVALREHAQSELTLALYLERESDVSSADVERGGAYEEHNSGVYRSLGERAAEHSAGPSTLWGLIATAAGMVAWVGASVAQGSTLGRVGGEGVTGVHQDLVAVVAEESRDPLNSACRRTQPWCR